MISATNDKSGFDESSVERSKISPKVIIEGTHLTRKTDVAFLLAEHPRVIGHRGHRWHVPLVSAEWDCCRLGLEDKNLKSRSMINFYPQQLAWAMDCYHTYARLFELQRDWYWVVDRFHISSMVYQKNFRNIELDFRWLEERLVAEGFVLALLTRSPETFSSARDERLEYSENPTRYRDLERFVNEQSQYREYAADSILPTVEIDISDDNISRAAGEILDYVEFGRT